MTRPPILLGSAIYHQTGQGNEHPLAWPKTAPTLDVIRSLNWFDPSCYVEAQKAIPRRIKQFHDSTYVDVAFDAERRQEISKTHRRSYGLGSSDNPIFPGVIDRAATACGAALKAAELLIEPGIVHSPLGGAHHAQPARASGFGYFNDLVLGILALRASGLKRIAYVDLDAHHGDAVEAAFAYNRDVMTFSIHQENCWPDTGIDCDPDFNIYNIPVPADFNDTESAYVMDTAITPRIAQFQPDAIVIQAGTDSLGDDIMMDLGLSNRAYYTAVDTLRTMAPRIWVTGGGAYNPWSVVRCWAGIWCVLNGKDPANEPPIQNQEAIIAQIERSNPTTKMPDNWLSSLVDVPRIGTIRPAVKEATARALT